MLFLKMGFSDLRKSLYPEYRQQRQESGARSAEYHAELTFNLQVKFVAPNILTVQFSQDLYFFARIFFISCTSIVFYSIYQISRPFLVGLLSV